VLAQNQIATTYEQQINALNELGGLDALGSHKVDNMYHAGWAWAGSTPYRSTKLIGAQEYQSQLGGYPKWVQGESTPQDSEGNPINRASNINIDEKNDNVNYQVTFSTANGTGYQRQYIDTDNSHFRYNPSTHALTVGTIQATTLTTGAATTTGTITGRWSLTTNSRFEATYADLAEYYEGDTEYEVGTVLIFGGDKEVTVSGEHRSTKVAGVVSDQSAYTMNDGCPGIKVLTALQGKVPVKVIGKVEKGDMLVASSIAGYAVVDNDPKVGSVIGKAIESKDDTERGTVHAVVGRV